jgi:large subunit ribosomal protein L1
MSKDEKKQEEQAQAEEKSQVAEVINDENTDVVVEGNANVAESAEKEVKEQGVKAGPKARRAKEESLEEPKEAAKPDTAKKRVVHVPNQKKRHGKNYLAALELVDRSKQYELEEAVKLAKQTSKVKFDAAVELHTNLGIDPRQADQTVRTTVVLPAGTGKSLRVAVLASSDQQAAAKSAGADLVGDDNLIGKIEKGQLDFDILIATPDMMPKLAKLAKVLGPKGLMPNPKSGTVTVDVAKAVKDAKAGKVEFRTDKQGIVHQAVGRVSFSEEDLLTNLKTLIGAIMKAKPAAAKGTYVKAMTLTTSMGPGIKLNTSKVLSDLGAKK